MAFLVGQPLPLGKDQAHKVIALLENINSDLKFKQEQEMNDLKGKLSKLKRQKKNAKSSENEVEKFDRSQRSGSTDLAGWKGIWCQIGFLYFKA